MITVAFACLVLSTTDGDTFRCEDGTRVRIFGINAPEHNEPGGPQATHALAKLINNKTLTCHRKGTSYNRTVALCTLHGQDIAWTQVRGGYAVDWPRYSHGRYSGVGR